MLSLFVNSGVFDGGISELDLSFDMNALFLNSSMDIQSVAFSPPGSWVQSAEACTHVGFETLPNRIYFAK